MPDFKPNTESAAWKAGAAAADRTLDEHPEIEEAIRQGVRKRDGYDGRDRVTSSSEE